MNAPEGVANAHAPLMGGGEIRRVENGANRSAAESDSASLIPVIENQIDHGRQLETLLADTAYGADENVEACRKGGIALISPVVG